MIRIGSFCYRDGAQVLDLSKAVHQLFISLYDDDNEEVGKIVAEFWEQDLKSREDTRMLFLELLEMLATDKNALHIVIDLVIKRCSLSPDYPKTMFESLGDCVFQVHLFSTSSYDAREFLYSCSQSCKIAIQSGYVMAHEECNLPAAVCRVFILNGEL